jgi:hypothetical protein
LGKIKGNLKKATHYLLYGATDVLDVEFGRFADVRDSIKAACEAGSEISVSIISKDAAKELQAK